MPTEALYNLGTRTMREEIAHPGNPALQHPGWEIHIEEGRGWTYFEIVNPSKGRMLGGGYTRSEIVEIEREEEVPELVIVPGSPHIFLGGSNPNTAYFATTQSCMLVLVKPQIEPAVERLDSETAKAELIKEIIPLQFPEEVDQLMARTAALMERGCWDPKEPVLVCALTKAMFAEIARLDRAGKISVTG
ncbi:MAG: hypothetical protein A3B74_00985 [Candidatus Kerfeldbacteria bacterium RIFCSPHIGHO2_02_FULL_42_14]|uniref:Uncharacterized protein n=1 Tax=Candidatus Kerfeldbacteria bacterium RIFCSPHIGHO2_02_FULL_42_14 TaxID=1798540 RepID=A0A1G2ATQ0_9BACT|nr:MAG: hypothetical protein A3B74_00985 [Candidatus Kerfeldbacteria bacterium RIFCSPHIGHO2_02_FULL_42_14]OGY81928.1 MAG: hypothetical protein A3E60_01065 [Candidatus Kerfeldbacteria bacterium RIFCSPHIGHO2_12_FULL_42_13]OGY83437.1 MAG: hypothetical protein A3I91_02190 [Candidatus Kerfeldbacteria bacterium RIFCSPLOWO2_02_FULL_42_19]